ncbi:MAG: hypothetical protein IPI03_20755 [Rubrivivax sp.]|nr:hypothetical protein [Rubrivivax sp.]
MNCQPLEKPPPPGRVRPRNLSTIESTIGKRWSSSIAIDSASQDQAIVHLRPVVGVLQVGESQSPAHLANELAQQLQWVVVRLADHPKLIPGRAAIAQLERVDGHASPEQPGSELEVVLRATPVDHAHGFEHHVLESPAARGGWLRPRGNIGRKAASIHPPSTRSSRHRGREWADGRRRR